LNYAVRRLTTTYSILSLLASLFGGVFFHLHHVDDHDVHPHEAVLHAHPFEEARRHAEENPAVEASDSHDGTAVSLFTADTPRSFAPWLIDVISAEPVSNALPALGYVIATSACSHDPPIQGASRPRSPPV
jgi:hypothetical protein